MKSVPEEDVVVDVILTSTAHLKPVNATDYRALSMLFRYLEINSYYSTMDGLLRAKFAYPHVNFRYIISPTVTLPSSYFPLVTCFYLRIRIWMWNKYRQLLIKEFRMPLKLSNLVRMTHLIIIFIITSWKRQMTSAFSNLVLMNLWKLKVMENLSNLNLGKILLLLNHRLSNRNDYLLKLY